MRTRSTRFTGLVIAAGLAAVLAACGGDDGGADPTTTAAGPASSSEAGTAAGPAPGASPDVDLSKVTLRIATQTSEINRRLIEASGVLDDTPYEIDWAYFDGANSTIEALNAGAVDVSVGLASTGTVLAQANAPTPWTADDAPFRIVAATRTKEFSGSTIMVHADSGIETIDDLRGKKIGFAKGSFHHFFLVATLQEAGIPLSDVDIVTMPIAEARPAYDSGALDVLVTGVASGLPFVRSGDSKILTTSEGFVDFFSLVVAHQRALDDQGKAAAVADLLPRLVAADEWSAANPDAVTRLFEDVEKRTPEDAADSARLNPSDYFPVDDAFAATQQRQADIFFAEGVTSSEIDVRIAIDPRYNDIVEAAAAGA